MLEMLITGVISGALLYIKDDFEVVGQSSFLQVSFMRLHQKLLFGVDKLVCFIYKRKKRKVRNKQTPLSCLVEWKRRGKEQECEEEDHAHWERQVPGCVVEGHGLGFNSCHWDPWITQRWLWRVQSGSLCLEAMDGSGGPCHGGVRKKKKDHAAVMLVGEFEC